MSPPRHYRRGDGEGRRHPERLAKEDYRRPGTVIFVTFCRKAQFNLHQPHVCEAVAAAGACMGLKYGVRVEAYCVMPDHVHIAVQILRETAEFEKWVRYTKRESQRAIDGHMLWQRSFWDESAKGDPHIRAMVLYTLENPVRQGLCRRYDEWPYSWSRWHPETRGPDPDSYT